MLAYGCPHVLFKMDRTGVGQEVCLARLPEARSPSFVGFSRDMFLEATSCKSLPDFSSALALQQLHASCLHLELGCRLFNLLVSHRCLQLGLRSALRIGPEWLRCMQMCILAGCDFLKALSKIGIKKAHAHIRKFKTFVRVRMFLSRNDRPLAPHIYGTSAFMIADCIASVSCCAGDSTVADGEHKRHKMSIAHRGLARRLSKRQQCATGVALH